MKLAHLCVCSENQDATEYDFRKALEVADQIKDYTNKNDLLLHIWCSAILRDGVWRKHLEGIESPIEALRHTMFYKLTDLAITLGKTNLLERYIQKAAATYFIRVKANNLHFSVGCRPEEVLPPIDMLLNAPDLGALKDDTNFQYLIKLGYDYFFRTQMLESSYSI